MTSELAVVPMMRELFRQTGFFEVLPETAFDAGMEQLKTETAIIALEVLNSEAAGIPLHEAVLDQDNNPKLYRLHTTMKDFLTLELPKELLGWVEQLFRLRDLPFGTELRAALGQLAVDPEASSIARTLARVFLFEATRMALSIEQLRNPRGFASRSIEDKDLDRIAHRVLRWWLQSPEVREETRPLNMLIAGAMLELEQHAEELKAALSGISQEALQYLVYRGRLEEALAQMNRPDALLLRNAMAATLGEQPVTVETLQHQHAMALGDRSRASLDKQAQRLRERMARGELPMRRPCAVIDFVELQGLEAGELT